MTEIRIKNTHDLKRAAAEFIKATAPHRLFSFYGQMGSGKTTFIKALCEQLGALNTVTSPTFTLINEYRTHRLGLLYHIDFYRIRKKEEVFDFGIEEYFDSGAYCFMEWPELVEDIIPSEAVKVRLSVNDDMSRVLAIELPA